MASPIDERQTKALESIAESLNYFMRKDQGDEGVFAPNFQHRVTHEPVQAVGKEGGSWAVTSEERYTKRLHTVNFIDRDFRSIYVSLVAEAPPEPAMFEHRKSHEVVSVVPAVDGSGVIIVTHADGRPDERLTQVKFAEQYLPTEPPSIKPPPPPPPAPPEPTDG
jgi:hypothetical protein